MGQTLLHIYHWSSIKSGEECEPLRQDLVHWPIASGSFYFSYLLWISDLLFALLTSWKFVQRPGIVEIGQVGVVLLPWFCPRLLPRGFFSSVFCTIWAWFWWEIGIYQTRYHFVQEFPFWSLFFFFHCEILQIWYHECKNWLLFVY